MGTQVYLEQYHFGAKLIEKHFTLSNDLNGPDHKFSMTPKSWKEMIERSKELESSLVMVKKKLKIMK